MCKVSDRVGRFRAGKIRLWARNYELAEHRSGLARNPRLRAQFMDRVCYHTAQTVL